MRSLFHRHRVRGTFYHGVAIIFLLATLAWSLGLISDIAGFYISATLFLIDYIAEMYDPHPDSPGPWFQAHFHRFFDNDNSNDPEYEAPERISIFKWLMTAPEEDK